MTDTFTISPEKQLFLNGRIALEQLCLFDAQQFEHLQYNVRYDMGQMSYYIEIMTVTNKLHGYLTVDA
jgi:hypothetical protein